MASSTPSDLSPLNVLIIGAGIAGLSAAIALGKQGHHVVILEKSRFAKESGAAIHLPPNCTSLLAWMGVDPEDFGGTLLQQIDRYGHEGNLTYRSEFSEVRKQWQSEWYLVHRVDLHNYLKKQALKTATLHTACKIVSIDIDKTRVVLDDGREFSGDLLLGADGVHSMLRQEIAPGAAAPYSVGKACFRWLVPIDRLRQLDSTKDTVRDSGVFVEWSAKDRRLVAYPCSNDTVFNVCAFVPSAESGIRADEGWQAVGNKDVLIQALSSFSSDVREIANQADENLKVWEMQDMEPLPSWTRGRAAILGDAAHPFMPYMGQGGAMAIEDAVSIATLLPRGTKVEDVASRLELYETGRRSRIELVLYYTRMNGRDENDEGGEEAARIPPEEMVRFMNICFTHNEITHSSQLLAQAQAQQNRKVVEA